MLWPLNQVITIMTWRAGDDAMAVQQLKASQPASQQPAAIVTRVSGGSVSPGVP